MQQALGYTQRELADFLGITQASVFEALKQDGSIGAKILNGFSVKTGCVDWLLTGKGEMFLQDGAMTIPKNTTLIRLMDFGAGAGGAQEGHDDAPKALLEVDARWLAREVHARPEDLVIIPVEGRSMEPTLPSGALLVVDTAHTTPTREGVYVLRVGEGVLVKRIEWMPDGGMLIKSDNSKYRTHEIAPDSQEVLTAIGRVVWMMKPM